MPSRPMTCDRALIVSQATDAAAAAAAAAVTSEDNDASSRVMTSAVASHDR